MYMYRKALPDLFDHGSDCNDWPIKVEKRFLIPKISQMFHHSENTCSIASKTDA